MVGKGLITVSPQRIREKGTNKQTHDLPAEDDVLPPDEVDPPGDVTILPSHVDPLDRVLQQ